MSFESLQVRKLSRSFPDFQIHADFHVDPAERVALFAPSGSGKSTLLRIIAGLDPDGSVRGELRIGEESLVGIPPEKRNIGMVFQEGHLFPQMTAAENVAYPLKLRGVGRAERHAQAEAWLERVELKKRASHYPHELSGGERQRVAFARAMIFNPRLILLDEAFSALDLRLRSNLSTLFMEIHAKFPVPVLFVTHDSQERDRLSTRVLSYSASASLVEHSFTD